MPVEVKIVPDNAALNRAAAQEFARLAESAVSARGRFSVALSGGNTPRDVYALLAEQYQTTLAWDKIHIFFGDERNVPPGHPDSNYRMANEALLSKVVIPPGNIHRIQAELGPEAAVKDYQLQLKAFFHLTDDWPRFDLIFLGLGDDGHTASLFPGFAGPGGKFTDRHLQLGGKAPEFSHYSYLPCAKSCGRGAVPCFGRGQSRYP